MASRDHGGGRDRPVRSRARLGWLALLALAVLVGLGAALGIGELGRDLEPGRLMERIRALGPWGQAAVVGLMVVHSFVPFPAEILALCAGALYGTLWGTALVWAGAMAGAALSFGLARWLGRPFVEAMPSARNQARLERWSRFGILERSGRNGRTGYQVGRHLRGWLTDAAVSRRWVSR